MKQYFLVLCACWSVFSLHAQSNLNIQKIGETPHPSWLDSQKDQIDFLPALGSISVIFQNNTHSGNGGSLGQLRYALSRDAGVNWDINPMSGNTEIGVINPLQGANTGSRSRYPDVGLWLDGSTVKMAWTSYITDGTGWIGRGNGTVEIGSNEGEFTVADESYDLTQAETEAIQGGISQRVSGEFWYARLGMTGGFLSGQCYIYKGVYNSSTLKVEWNQQQILALTLASINNQTHCQDPAIHFSPDGNKGWLTFLGDLAGGQDSVFLPIFSEFDAATETFGAAYEIPLNQFPDVMTHIQQWTNANNQPLYSNPSATFVYDAIVDSVGNPHFFFNVAPKTNPYEVSFERNRHLYDLTNNNGWQLILIDTVDAGQNSNTWIYLITPLTINPSYILSCSATGSRIFYHWNDTDEFTAGFNGQNTAPDLFGRGYHILSQQLTPTINWTSNDPDWAKIVHFPKGSERIQEDRNCNYEIPIILPFHDNPFWLNIYYASGVRYNCNDFNETPIIFTTQFTGNEAQVSANFALYPNPAQDFVRIESTNQAEKALLSIENINGQVLYQESFSFSSEIPLHSFPKGIYFVKLQSEKRIEVKKLVIE